MQKDRPTEEEFARFVSFAEEVLLTWQGICCIITICSSFIHDLFMIYSKYRGQYQLEYRRLIRQEDPVICLIGLAKSKRKGKMYL